MERVSDQRTDAPLGVRQVRVHADHLARLEGRVALAMEDGQVVVDADAVSKTELCCEVAALSYLVEGDRRCRDGLTVA